jgi:hypothetical protein
MNGRLESHYSFRHEIKLDNSANVTLASIIDMTWGQGGRGTSGQEPRSLFENRSIRLMVPEKLRSKTAERLAGIPEGPDLGGRDSHQGERIQWK